MAFFQSQPPREPFLNVPASVLALIGLIVAIHLVIAVVPVPLEDWAPYAFVAARFTENTAPQALAVPFVSHIFLHGNFLHLTINCLWLLAFGPVVARRLGPVLFYAFFLLSGIAGAAMELALTWGTDAAMIGALGAIAGLMAAGFRLMRWPGSPQGVRLVPVLSRPVLLFSGLWLAVNLVFGIVGMGQGAGSIAWQAHMGGYLFGLFAIGLFDRRGMNSE